MFHNKEIQVTSITAQNRFAGGLCTPSVLMCLEWFSKRSEIIFIIIKNQPSIDLICIQAQIRNIARNRYIPSHKTVFLSAGHSRNWECCLQKADSTLQGRPARLAYGWFQKGLCWSQLCLFGLYLLEHIFVVAVLSVGATSWHCLQGSSGFYYLQK